MKSWGSKLYNIWQLTRSSLFYVPVLVSLIFVAAVLMLFWFEVNYSQYTNKLSYLYAGNIEDSKDILQTILSGLITMTTLVISITMVVLSLSASQLGPRLIKTFMSSRKTQIYIGIFFGSIAVCLTVLILLHDQSMFDKPPKLTISASLALTFINLFVLLSYVNHVARSGIADTTIERVTLELENSLSRLTTSNQEAKKESEIQLPSNYNDEKKDIYCSCSGYVQNIQYPALVSLAEEHDLIINLEFIAGSYLFKGQNIGSVFPANKAHAEVEKNILDCLDIGSSRTGAQDIEYSIRHLVEIGLRALSPGINDDFTAITVLDKLSGALLKILTNDIPDHIYYSSNNKIKVIGNSIQKSGIIYRAFSQIRDAGKKKPDILLHIITILGKLKNNLSHTQTSSTSMDGIKEQAEYIKQHTEQYFKNTKEESLVLGALKKYDL